MSIDGTNEQWRGPIYGRVFFALRDQFDLTTLECLLLDLVDTLSRRTGWCFASRQYLARFLGVSVRSVQRMLVTLREKELIEYRSAENRLIRPTGRWQSARTAEHS